MRAVAGCVVLALLLAGCTTTQKGAGIGAATGAALGAIIGHQSGETGEGAVIGAAAGAAVGAAVGDQMERRRGSGLSGGTRADMEARANLRATLTPLTPVVRSGEPLRFDFELENVGTRELVISSKSYYQDADLVLNVEDEHGMIADETGAPVEFFSHKAKGTGMVTLPPGGVIKAEIVVHTDYDRLEGEIPIYIPHLRRPGTYRIRAIAYHRYTFGPVRDRVINESRLPAIGTASNAVTVTVEQ